MQSRCFTDRLDTAKTKHLQNWLTSNWKYERTKVLASLSPFFCFASMTKLLPICSCHSWKRCWLKFCCCETCCVPAFLLQSWVFDTLLLWRSNKNTRKYLAFEKELMCKKMEVRLARPWRSTNHHPLRFVLILLYQAYRFTSVTAI